jgi:IclR family transcriptional regulator, acetate operon repressor
MVASMIAAQDQATPNSVLERVFAILDCFTIDASELTLAELAARTGIPKPTVHRLTRVLTGGQLLKRTPTGVTLGLRLFELGELVDERRHYRDVSLPFLEELFEQTHETIHLGVLEGSEILYFVKIVGYQSFPLPTRTGGRWPAHASALGKILLAYGPPDAAVKIAAGGLKQLTAYTITDEWRLVRELATVRRTGIGIESQESVLGNACVAAPIFDASSRAVAAVSVSGPPMRLRPAQRAPLVRRTAALITHSIDGRPPAS